MSALLNNDSSHGFSVQSLDVNMRHSSGMGHRRSDEVNQAEGRHHHITAAVNPIQQTKKTSFVLFSAFCYLTKHLRPQDPVQEWGEEEEDGAVFGVTLRREPMAPPLTPSEASELSSAFSFIQYHTVKVRRLKAATLERLLTHLLDAEQQEPDFLPAFLSTYRAFTSTGTLVELLFQR